jgi:hypothetical protein
VIVVAVIVEGRVVAEISTKYAARSVLRLLTTIIIIFNY